MDMEIFNLGFEATLFGLAGVFAVLILFYFVTKIMVGISNKYTKE